MTPAYEPLARGVRMLASVCDGAVDKDNSGFNGGDSEFGHAMALKEDFSPRMAAALCKLLPKYRRQLGDALTEQILAVRVQGASQPLGAAPARDGACSPSAAPASATAGPLVAEALLPWGEPQSIYTRNGERTVRKADIPEGSPFWALWRERREDVKALNVGIFKNERRGGVWEATLWPPREGTVAAPPPPEAPTPAEVPAAIAAKLLPYQVAAVAKLVAAIQTYGTALDASDTGTGKTYIALAAARHLGLKPVVVCPKSVIPSWKRAARHFGVDIFATNYEQVKLGKTPYCTATRTPRLKKNGDPQVDKKGKAIVDTVFEWTVADDEVVVVDECHRIGAMASQNADMAVAMKDAKAKSILLSATAADSPLAMRAIGYVLGLFPHTKAYWRWAFQNGVQKGRFGMEFTGGRAAMKRIHDQIFGRGKGNRLRIADIPEFPETSIYPEVVDFGSSAEIQRAYDDMAEALSHLGEVEKKDRQGIILTEILRARQRTELLKVPTLARMAEDAVAEGMSVALFVNFEETVQQLSSLLKTDCTITGAQQGDKGAAEREANIQRFQLGDYPRLSILNPSYSAKAVKQALGRVHRAVDKNEVPQWSSDCSRVIICNINAGGVGVSLHHLGGKKSVQRIVFAANTCEEDACLAVEKKVANIELLNNGDILNGLKIVGCDANTLAI